MKYASFIMALDDPSYVGRCITGVLQTGLVYTTAPPWTNPAESESFDHLKILMDENQ